MVRQDMAKQRVVDNSSEMPLIKERLLIQLEERQDPADALLLHRADGGGPDGLFRRRIDQDTPVLVP